MSGPRRIEGTADRGWLHLMHPTSGFDPRPGLCDEDALTRDLELEVLVEAMAGGDAVVADVVRRALFAGPGEDVETVLHRQAVLKDCLQHPEDVRDLYALAVGTLEHKRKEYWSWDSGMFHRYPSAILSGCISSMELFVGLLTELRDRARALAPGFASQGFSQLFEALTRELDDAYLEGLWAHLKELKFKDGVFLGGDLDAAGRGARYALLRTPPRPPWWSRLFTRGGPGLTFELDERDEAGARALGEIQDRGINAVANALAQSTDHLQGFIEALIRELAFYVGCLNLHSRLSTLGANLCFPTPLPAAGLPHRWQGLYDPCLALKMGRAVTGNEADASGRGLVVVTGANQGGKSSFLRSIGLAQLMTQCGMFAPAEAFSAALCPGLFTHFKREEDPTMKSGKFDEELDRLSLIVDRLRPEDLVLFNESFSTTNERESSQIAHQVVRALGEKGVRVFVVTHFYAFASGLKELEGLKPLFLRAERLDDGTRTFRLIEGDPLETSYGEDLYRRVFWLPDPRSPAG